MKKQKSSYGLILASIVAVVAMMGLVMMFGSHTTGAAFTNSYGRALSCPGGTFRPILSQNDEGRTITTNIGCFPGTSASGNVWTRTNPGVSWEDSGTITAWENEWTSTGASPEWQEETAIDKTGISKGAKGTETFTY